MPRERRTREEQSLSAPEHPLPVKMVFLIVGDEHKDDLLVVTEENVESPEVLALTQQVQKFEDELYSQVEKLNQRAGEVPSRNLRRGTGISRSERMEIYDELKRAENPITRRIEDCFDYFQRIGELETVPPSPGHTLVVTRREGEVVGIELNPQGEKEWWKFVTTPKLEWPISEAWEVYLRDPNLFLLLHDAFIRGFRYKQVKGDMTPKGQEAKAEFDQIRKVLGNLDDSEFEVLSPAMQKMMRVIGL